MVSEGWTLREARKWASDNNIKLKIKYEETDKYDKDLVIKQSKSSGDELISGQTLTLTISKEKAQDQTNPDDEDNQDEESKDSEWG